jgi:(2Fe-2S) ferredoxin
MYYKKHIFVCINQKEEGQPCCANTGGQPFFDYLKQKLKMLDLSGPGKIRVSKSGCLGRCATGPWLVVYPEGTWYNYNTYDDLDNIIHLIQQES